MTLLQLNYLAEVIKHGSINQAAKSLFVAQSSISNAIRELEDELGIAIFFRHNKGVRLTQDGERFFEDTRPILEQERKILTTYSYNNAAATLKLNISTLHYPFAVQALVAFVDSIKNNQYNIYYRETNIHYIINDVDSGQSDLGIIFMSDATQSFLQRVLQERSLSFHLLDRIVPHAFVRVGHPLTLKDTIDVIDLEHYPYVIFDLEYSSSNYSEEVLLKGFEKPKKVIHLSDRSSVYNVLHHTDAYSIGSGILPEGFADPEITSIPIQHPEDSIQLGYIKVENRKLSPQAEEFIALLKDYISQNKR